jgi:cobalt-zinc-cadmium efflux system membrane fusion protein
MSPSRGRFRTAVYIILVAAAFLPLAGGQAVAEEPTVTLTSGQFTAIKIAPAGTYPFRIEKRALGSVGLNDDPAVVQVESTLVGAAAALELAGKVLARDEALGQANGIAPKELQQAVSDQKTAAGALWAARDAVRVLGKTDADIDRMVASGRIDSPPAANRSAKWVVAEADEDDSPVFHIGQPVAVSAVALPGRAFDGHISEIYATVDPNTRRVTIRCSVGDPKDELRPGMFAEITAEVRNAEVSVAVPAYGVVREGDGAMTAWVTVDRQRFVQRMIRTGLREDGQVQVLEGVRPGELVVTNGAIFLDNILQAPPSD